MLNTSNFKKVFIAIVVIIFFVLFFYNFNFSKKVRDNSFAGNISQLTENYITIKNKDNLEKNFLINERTRFFKGRTEITKSEIKVGILVILEKENLQNEEFAKVIRILNDGNLKNPFPNKINE
jgi:hypothetical protein